MNDKHFLEYSSKLELSSILTSELISKIMMNKKFTVEKTDSLWKVKYDRNEWYFQTLEDLCIFMEDYFDSLEEVEINLFSYNNDKSIN